MVVRVVTFGLLAAFYAYAFLTLLLVIYAEFTGQNVMWATIWNFAVITFLILLERIELVWLAKLQARPPEVRAKWWARIAMGYLDGPSFKVAMYLIYPVVLIGAGIQAADPGHFPFLDEMAGFLQGTSYGVLYLIALEKGGAQIRKDFRAWMPNAGRRRAPDPSASAGEGI